MICASNHDNGGRIRMRGFVVLLADEHSETMGNVPPSVSLLRTARRRWYRICGSVLSLLVSEELSAPAPAPILSKTRKGGNLHDFKAKVPQDFIGLGFHAVDECHGCRTISGRRCGTTAAKHAESATYDPDYGNDGTGQSG
jgi:hypothetical protein